MLLYLMDSKLGLQNTMDYQIKANDMLKGLNLKYDAKELEKQLSQVENIVDFEREINKFLLKYNMHFTPRGAETK